MLSDATRIALTGATGLIGGEMLLALCDRGVENVQVLARSHNGVSASDRLRRRLARSGRTVDELSRQVRVVEADLAKPGLGLSPRDAHDALADASIVIHCAADTSFVRTRSCYETNVAGTKRLLDVLRGAGARPLVVLVSTAWSCGKVRSRCMVEDDHGRGSVDHANAYSESKALAERLVVESGLPYLILRPTIVLSADMADREFARSILWFVPLLRAFECLPIDPSSRLDVVSVDYVVQCTLNLLAREARRHDTFYVSAGSDRSVTGQDILTNAGTATATGRPLIGLVPDEWGEEEVGRYVSTPEQRFIFSRLRHYLPFINADVTFSNVRLRAELGSRMPPLVRASDYAASLLTFVDPHAALAEAANP